MALGALLACPASAAEVVWLTPPSASDSAHVARLARATTMPMSPAAFRAYATKQRDADFEAISRVDKARRDARAFEAELDGELKIVAAIEPALADVSLLRDANDREVIIRALLYQGFAVDRFWGDTLATAPDAVDYRFMVGSAAVERPWLDAYALDPLRVATDADIGEAPQLEAYGALRDTLSGVLQATVLAPDLPSGAVLVVDGREVPVDDTTVVELVPGRHWIHVRLDGHVVARYAERLDPGRRLEVTLPVPEADWRDLVRTLRRGSGAVPPGVKAAVEALGGDVWIAEGKGETLSVWQVTPTTVASVVLDEEAPEPLTASARLADVSVSAWAGGGWLYSSDFRDQDPGAVPGRAGVEHAVTPAVGLEIAWDREWLRYGLGVDLFVPVGEYHVALSSEGRYRLRPYAHVLLGHPLVQATFGWVAPYHIAGGGQVAVPVVDGLLEVRGGLVVGGTPTLVRPDGTSWTGGPLVSATVGVAGRLRPNGDPL